MTLFTPDGWIFLLRWLHTLAGIVWIGMLYYFNFVQTPFFTRAEAPVRTGMMTGGLVDTALWWFRWAAMVTFITGWLYILHVAFARYGGVRGFIASAYGWKILFGAMLGTTMWANVWFVIWPAQRAVIQSARQVASGGRALPEAAPRGARSGVASRTNTMLSIPMLFFMGAASHLTLGDPVSAGQKWSALILVAAVIAAAEVNAVLGAATPDKASIGKKLLTNPETGLTSTITAGFVLAAILYAGLATIL